jgi:polysaccharide export outer membrane protein
MRCTRIWTGLLVSLACLLMVACASQPTLVTNNPNILVNPDGLPAPDATASTYSDSTEYRIGPLDLLTISVFGVADLTQDARVDSLGNITLPLIGNVRAGGRTTVELQRDIAEKLTAGYLQSPQVSVFIKDYTSQRVTVEGNVKKPGIFPLTGSTSLLQVIASAQGLDDLADHRGIVVFRVIKGQKMAAVFDIDAIGRGASADPQIYGNDIVVVATSGSKNRLHNLIQAFPVLSVFRLY